MSNRSSKAYFIGLCSITIQTFTINKKVENSKKKKNRNIY